MWYFFNEKKSYFPNRKKFWIWEIENTRFFFAASLNSRKCCTFAGSKGSFPENPITQYGILDSTLWDVT